MAHQVVALVKEFEVGWLTARTDPARTEPLEGLV
jgi:hypothetical protein